MFHPLDATAMILGWNLGTAVLFLAGAAVFSRKVSTAVKDVVRDDHVR
jgi:hypothetical protein